MSQGLTKEDHTLTFGEFRKEINQRFDGIEARMTANTQDIIGHFNKSQGFQNTRMDSVEGKLDSGFLDVHTKLDALMEESSTRKELYNLVDELHHQGVSVDSKKIFLA